MKITEINESEWIGISADLAESNFFQQLPWLKLVSEIFDLINHYIKININDTNVYICLQCDNNKAYANFIGYGGFISSEQLSYEAMSDIIEGIEKEFEVKINRMKLFPRDKTELKGKPGWSAEITSVIKITPGWVRFVKKNAKNAVKNATKNGVMTRCLDSKYLDSFYSIYDQTMDRVNSSYKTPKLFFEKLLLFPDVYFVGAFHDNKLIATSIFLNHKEWSFYWWNVSSDDGRKYNANYLIMFSTINRLSTEGFRFLDMASSNNKGIIDFKNRWGAENMDFMIFDRR